MEPSLLQVYQCHESVGILHFWLGTPAPDTCLSVVISLLQLAVILAAIILIKHLVARKIIRTRANSRHVTPAGNAQTGWIGDKPAIYTKFPAPRSRDQHPR